MRIALALAIVLVVALVGYWALLYVRQRAMLFPAPPLDGAPVRPPDAEVIQLDSSDGPIEAWYLPPFRPVGRSPLILFTHGNGELIDYWPPAFVTPRRWGIGVMLVEYPGYGRSAGRPTERSVSNAVVAAFDRACAREDIDPSRIVAYGRSVGAGAATILAEARPVAAVILESAFTSVPAVARRLGAPALLVRDRFDNLKRIMHLRVPVLIVHGTEDRLVPVAHAHALHAAQPAAELILLPCGHNDCPPVWPEIERFLRAHRIIEPDHDL